MMVLDSKIAHPNLVSILSSLSQDASPHLSKGSSVIFISSISAYIPHSSMAMYAVTKTALLGLTKVVHDFEYSVGDMISF